MRLIIVLLLSFSSLQMMAQSDKFTLQQALDQALKNNLSIKASGFELESQKQLKKTSFDLPKTDISLLYGNIIVIPKTIIISVFPKPFLFRHWAVQVH